MGGTETHGLSFSQTPAHRLAIFDPIRDQPHGQDEATDYGLRTGEYTEQLMLKSPIARQVHAVVVAAAFGIMFPVTVYEGSHWKRQLTTLL